MNIIEIKHEIAKAVLLGDLKKRGRGNALRHFLKTYEILDSHSGLRDGIKDSNGNPM